MSLRVLGYDKDGRRIVEDQGPARARLAGQGGTVLGHVLVSKVTPILRTNAEIHNEARRRVREAANAD